MCENSEEILRKDKILEDEIAELQGVLAGVTQVCAVVVMDAPSLYHAMSSRNCRCHKAHYYFKKEKK